MKVQEHIAYGGVASVVMAPAFGWHSVFFFMGSVLIDFDHYLDFIYFTRFKDWSVKSMFHFHGIMSGWRKRGDFLALEAFHTAEFLISLGLLAFLLGSVDLKLLFAGMIFHLALDLYRLKQWGTVNIRALSFIEYWIRARGMRRRGIDPEKAFFDAYALVSEKNSGAEELRQPIPATQ